jgi:uncharacterized protein YabE (DUF348 family)
MNLTIVVDGHPLNFRTHQRSVEAVLREAGIEIRPEDAASPGLGEEVREGSIVLVRRAKPIFVEADGRSTNVYTLARTVGEVLQEIGIVLKPFDRITLNGKECNLSAALTSQTTNPGRDEDPLRITLKRAVPIYIEDGGVPITIYTTKETVEDALKDSGIAIYNGDGVYPDLSTHISSGMRIYIQRAKPISISVDGWVISARTQKEKVAQALAEKGVVLLGKDYTVPAEGERIIEGMDIRVVRVREEVRIEQEPIPFETAWLPDPELEIDHRRLEQKGEEGLKKRRIRLVYENGHEVERRIEEEWIAKEPLNKVIAYGTKIVIRELKTPEGNFKYWRKIRMLATSYTAATSGKEKGHPLYGITYLGWRAGKGIVAVDPKVINLRTKVYVPGYGVGVAADTGGKIKGRRIDLCYDEGKLKLWLRWVDVYLLVPPPPMDEIRWILPDWPKGR